MSTPAHVFDELPAHSLGSLDADEAALVADHLAACVVCRAELEAYHALAGGLALAGPETVPPADLRRRLMARIAARPSAHAARPAFAPRSGLRRMLPAWGWAGLTLIAALSIANLLLWQRVSQMATAPGGMWALPLSGLAAAPQADGVVVVGSDGLSGALVVDRLPALDTGREYQLWLNRDGRWISGAVFTTDERGYRGTRIVAPDSLFEYTSARVTVEPAGGSPRPTGEVVLAGPLFNR